MLTKEFIKKELLTVKGTLNNRAMKKHDLIGKAEDLYLIYNDIDTPICKECGKSHKFINFTNGYKETCSVKSCKSVSDRRKQTCLEKYGVDTIINRPDIKKLAINKASSKQSRNKVKETVRQKYGVDNISQLDSIKMKKEETSLKNFGYRHKNQSPESHSTYNFKDYTMPSGNVRKIQGHEGFLLDELIKQYGEDEILTDRRDMPEFWYEYQGKSKRYFPDVYIPSSNTIYEVKSEYTLNHNRPKNEAKFKSVRDNGYKFILKIY